MKNYILVCVLFFTIQITKAQSENSLVEKTIQNYIDGSSYNKLDLLKSAFAENATLYLTGKDGFKLYTPNEYVAFFKGKTEGVFNGRNGKVLTVEVVKDIARAKAEIAIPKRGMLYIDLFLLKKFDNGWKIISKTARRIDDNQK